MNLLTEYIGDTSYRRIHVPGGYLSLEEAEKLAAALRKFAQEEYEEKLYRYESPAYSYWAKGFPDGPWASNAKTEVRRAWDKGRGALEAKIRHLSTREDDPEVTETEQPRRWFRLFRRSSKTFTT